MHDLRFHRRGSRASWPWHRHHRPRHHPRCRFTRISQSSQFFTVGRFRPVFFPVALRHSLGEQDPISLPGRIHTDVVLGLLRVRQKGLDDERVEGSRGLFDRDGFASAFLYPIARDLVVLVEAEETGLASTLDELVGLGDELVCGGRQRRCDQPCGSEVRARETCAGGDSPVKTHSGNP